MYFALTLLSILFRIFPRKIILIIGKGLGIIIFYLYPIRKSIALKNISIAFPNYNKNEKYQLLKSCYKHYGMVFIDFLRLPKFKKEENKIISNMPIDSIELMNQYEGGILLSAHIGNWEYIGPTLSNYGIKCAGVTLVQRNSSSNKFFNNLRTSKYMKTIASNAGSKIMIEHITSGYYLGLISDQNAKNRGTRSLFFNQPVSVPKGAAAFHLKTNTPIVVGFCILCKDLHYELSFQKMNLEDLPKNSDDAIIEINNRFTKILEEIVKKYPEQYFWFHRKWNIDVYKGISNY